MNEVMSILQEECAEVIQAVSKINRFGMEGRHPETGPTNVEHLATEVGDVLCMVELLMERGVLNYEAVNKAKVAKREKLKKWSNITNL